MTRIDLLSNPMTTAEDVIVGGASGVPERLPVGSNGDVLSVVAGAVAWGPPAAGGTVRAFKGSDQVVTATSFADVTDMTFAVEANKDYHFRFAVFLITSGTGEGYQLSINGPTGTYKVGGILPIGATNPASGNIAEHSAGAAADTGGLSTTAGPGNAQPVMALVEGVVEIGGSGGTLALRVRAETGGANSVTIQARTYGEVTEIT